MRYSIAGVEIVWSLFCWQQSLLPTDNQIQL